MRNLEEWRQDTAVGILRFAQDDSLPGRATS